MVGGGEGGAQEQGCRGGSIRFKSVRAASIRAAIRVVPSSNTFHHLATFVLIYCYVLSNSSLLKNTNAQCVFIAQIPNAETHNSAEVMQDGMLA